MVNKYAPYSAGDKGNFVVKNIAPSKKTLRIFQYPIPYGQTRDLLEIPGVSEADIRVSLLKGELRTKIRAQEIIVIENDAELIQFNESQKSFLEAAGVINGLEVGASQLTQEVIDAINAGGGGLPGATWGAEDEAKHQALRQLIHFIDEGPAQGFSSGAFKEILPEESVFPTQVIWWTSVAKTHKIVEKISTWNLDNNPTSIQWRMYASDGVTVAATITDTITYSGPFELNRVRTIT